MDYSSSQESDILLSLRISNSFSLFGNLSIILLYSCYESLRSYGFRLLFFMSIADGIRSLGFLLPLENDALCIIQGFLTNYGSISGIIWTSLIAYSLYCIVIIEVQNIKGFQNYCLSLGFFFPLITSSLPFITDSYGQAEGWCWIKPGFYQVIWRMGTFYSIIVALLIFNIWCYYKIIKELRYEIEMLKEADSKFDEKKMLLKRFFLHPLAIIICYLPILCKRLYEINYPDNNTFWLTIFSGVINSLIGLLNAVIYGASNNVVEVITSSCKTKEHSEELLNPYESRFSINQID